MRAVRCNGAGRVMPHALPRAALRGLPPLGCALQCCTLRCCVLQCYLNPRLQQHVAMLRKAKVATVWVACCVLQGSTLHAVPCAFLAAVACCAIRCNSLLCLLQVCIAVACCRSHVCSCMLQCCLLHGVCCLWQRFLLCMPHGVCLCMLRSRTSSGARCLFCGSQDAWFHVACNMLQFGTLPVLPAATPHGCRMLAEGVAACRMLVCVLHGACFLVAAAAVWFGVSHPAGRRFDAAVACCLPHATWCVVRACCVRSVARFTSLLRVACFPSAHGV